MLNFRSRTSHHIALLLLACFFLLFFKMGARDLWNPDEPRYAQVAREMMETGEWIVPHLNGEVYTQKPPLYFWLTALISKPFGDVSEVTARLPSAMCAALVVLLTYLLGAKMLDRQAAFWGALLMATSAQFFWNGRVGALDMTLTLSVLATMTCFYLAYSGGRPLLYVAGFISLTPGVLTKGPVALAIPLVVMLAFFAVEIILRKEGAAKKLGLFAASATVGLLAVALIIVPWWEAAHERSGGVYGSLSILLKQTGGRMFKSYSHQRPFHFFFVQILWQYLPWTLFFPLTIHAVWKKGDLRQNTGLRFLLCWFLAVFIFFTCISGKRGQYLLPLFPAGGLILGWALTVSSPFEGALKERKAFWIPLLALALGAAAALVALVIGAYLEAPEHLTPVIIAVCLAGACLSLLARHCISRPPAFAVTSVVALMLIVAAAFYGYGAPALDRFKSARPFSDELLAMVEEGDGVYFYGFYRPNIHYYMGREVPRLQWNINVVEALKSTPRAFLILEDKHEAVLNHGVSEKLFRVEKLVTTKIGSRVILCVLAYPPDAPG